MPHPEQKVEVCMKVRHEFHREFTDIGNSMNIEYRQSCKLFSLST